MCPYPSCCVIDPALRDRFFDRLTVYQGYADPDYEGISDGMQLSEFDKLRQEISLFDAFRCAIVDQVPERAGVYALWNEDAIVYIGKSKSSIAARVNSHKLDKIFTDVSALYVYGVIGEDQEREITCEESFLISLLTPKYNKCIVDDSGCYNDWGIRFLPSHVPNGQYWVEISVLSGRVYALEGSFPTLFDSKWRLTHNKVRP